MTTSDSSQALKMVVINIFNIHHVAQNSGKSDSSPTVSSALQLCTLTLCVGVKTPPPSVSGTFAAVYTHPHTLCFDDAVFHWVTICMAAVLLF